jgi:hypothetical protein
MTRTDPCPLPPPGWYCTREPGHAGPCAAWPDSAWPLGMRSAFMERQADAFVASQAPLPARCMRPPRGWRCDLDEGHEGPCPVRAVAVSVPPEPPQWWSAEPRPTRWQRFVTWLNRSPWPVLLAILAIWLIGRRWRDWA